MKGAIITLVLALAACGHHTRTAPVSPPSDGTGSSAIAGSDAAAAPAEAGPDDQRKHVAGVCADSLCGLDSYCSCSGSGEKKRCWSAAVDCEVDAACCAKRPGYCAGLRLDDCADATAKARKARDAAGSGSAKSP